MITLTRSEPAKNMHRFYALYLTPNLFGEWVLVAEWGAHRLTRHGAATALPHGGYGESRTRQALAGQSTARLSRLTSYCVGITRANFQILISFYFRPDRATTAESLCSATGGSWAQSRHS